MALDLGPARQGERVEAWRELYDRPYRGHRAGRVLVVGAGTGNDVQAALRAGASQVTAVEIDPRILELGRSLHPERPYDDPRVRVVIDDARTWLHSADERYDTVVYGFLDSHTLLSSFSTLRIDNFVYTVEGLIAAVSLLEPGGRLAVTFTTATPWLRDRLHGLVTLALGQPPDSERVAGTNGRIFVGTRSPSWQPASPGLRAAVSAEMALPTDDWPFLYLKRPGLPLHYLVFIAVVLLLGFGSFLLVERAQRRFNLEFFFLGAGFMLLETRSITEMALLFGSTWAVNALAFGGILAFVLGANLVATRWQRPPPALLYGLVALLLLLGWGLGVGALQVEPVVLRLGLAALVLYAPVLVAGVVFSTRFRDAASPNLCFGSNLVGAMVGGAIEYLSMAFGLGALYPIGAALYLAAWLAARRG
jgi:SAM-dependent methyltransferase